MAQQARPFQQLELLPFRIRPPGRPAADLLPVHLAGRRRKAKAGDRQAQRRKDFRRHLRVRPIRRPFYVRIVRQRQHRRGIQPHVCAVVVLPVLVTKPNARNFLRSIDVHLRLYFGAFHFTVIECSRIPGQFARQPRGQRLLRLRNGALLRRIRHHIHTPEIAEMTMNAYVLRMPQIARVLGGFTVKRHARPFLAADAGEDWRFHVLLAPSSLLLQETSRIRNHLFRRGIDDVRAHFANLVRFLYALLHAQNAEGVYLYPEGPMLLLSLARNDPILAHAPERIVDLAAIVRAADSGDAAAGRPEHQASSRLLAIRVIIRPCMARELNRTVPLESI